MAGFKFGLELDASKYKKGSDEAATATEELVDELANMERRGTSSVEDVAHAFGDISSAADRAGADIADELTAGADEAEQAARSLEQRFRDALDGAGASAATLSDDVKTAAGEIKGAVEDNAITAGDIFRADLKAELVANMAEAGAEVVRGFKDGFDSEDMGTVVDAITDTMVSVGTLGGPVGVAAGLAGGAVVQMFAGPLIADAEAKAAQFEATFSTAFSNIVESGASLGRELSIAASVDEFAQDTQKMNDATTTANALGIERGVVLRAMAGDIDALNIVEGKNTALLQEQADLRARVAQEMTDHVTVTDETAAAMEAMDAKTRGLAGAVDSVTDSYDTNTDALNAATEAADAKAEADEYAARKAEESAAAMDRTTGAADGLTDAVNGVPDSVSIRAEATNIDWTNVLLNSAATGRNVPFVAGVDPWQAQWALDRAAAALRPPSVQVNLNYGMRAV